MTLIEKFSKSLTIISFQIGQIYMSFFHPVGIAHHGSKIQLQVSENINKCGKLNTGNCGQLLH